MTSPAAAASGLAPRGAGPPAAPPPQRLRRLLSALGFAALVVGLGAATVSAATSGNPILAVVPVALVAVAWVVVHVPLRWPAAILVVLALTIDTSSPSWGQWHTPLVAIGDLLHQNLPGITLSGMELLSLFLIGLGISRRGGQAQVDRQPLQILPLVRDVMLVYAAGVLFAQAHGMLQGQGPALWKVRNLLQPLMYFFLFTLAFRVPRDYRLLAGAVIFAATFRALLSVIVQRIALTQQGGEFATATSHGDSPLFATAIFILLAELMERPSRTRLVRAAVFVPVILVGEEFNNRRIFWVMMILMLALAWVVSPLRGWKRSFTRLGLVTAPILLLYVTAGWDSSAGVFSPVRTIRSVIDTSYDHSAYWREVENWNIATGIRRSPLVGVGLGGAYTEYMENDDLSAIFADYRQWPHNSILGMLLLMGVFAFTAVWLIYPVALFLSLRAHRLAAAPEHRVAALTSAAVLVACLVMAYGDTGVAFAQTKIFMGMAFAVGCMVATATGAWAAPRREDAAR